MTLPLPPRVPSTGGSFVATAAGATFGAAAGLAAGIVLAPRAQGICALSVGGGCTTELDAKSFAFIFGTTVVGSTAGAVLGRHLTHGRQDIGNTVIGAVGGLLTGALIVAHLPVREPVPAVITISIPTGLLATLAGW